MKKVRCIWSGDILSGPNAVCETFMEFYSSNHNKVSLEVFFYTLVESFKENDFDPKYFAKNNKITFEAIFDPYFFCFICPDNIDYDREGIDAFENWIITGSVFAKLCDFFGVKIKPQKSPKKIAFKGSCFEMEEGDLKLLKEAVSSCSRKDCLNFARFFSDEKFLKWIVKNSKT
jgi:hypothetical protein